MRSLIVFEHKVNVAEKGGPPHLPTWGILTAARETDVKLR
jgi:hypothetical protein